jgi:hypothetical protein
MKVTVVSKDPPGGRCTLYLRYAEVIADGCGAEVETVYPATGSAIEPPALLVDGRLIAPSDGLILSPMDVHLGLVGAGCPDLLNRLEAAEARFMDECGA